MPEPTWITEEFALAIHERQLAEHGGGTGIRDRGMFESAMARPRQLYAYGGDSADIPALVAAYAFGLARNHPFVDGNKRTAYVVCRTFLMINGWDLVNSLDDRYAAFISMSSGEMDEKAFRGWMQSHARPQQVSEPAGEYT
ncbi:MULTISPECIES: type II toxin-antitoxin system death-on-curing family toxin [unclassified Wenzhouxiangella]|uniref:type II toxin-antitoxin system death-on-curing family toxin n=1 Tax=unclassified Wenzhouxiangella TaxID=2613841 RepID=UPI000E32B8A4|nr:MULTISPECIES: type II toxin-antitoxin system death-on-curing family toxin [unclassified Wenzhouxiangella]RFF26700.1 type II toxin-antitoxin system death-on-curing family toxin [Wenzhouxiangella sp. 15181]RFP69330.1 type II toxin-antitoxin system death-on-curing family toxin [Wenzhouxiangella sp. 15190]